MSVRSARTCCYATLKFIPVFFILAVVGWSYYAYVVQMCIRKFKQKRFVCSILYQMILVTVESVPQKGKEFVFCVCEKEMKMFLVIYLCIYHPLLILFLWSYYRTMFETSIGPPREVKKN